MTGYAGLIQQGSFFGSILVVLTALFTAAIYPMLQSKLQTIGARTRASVLLGLCSLPAILTFVVLFAALLPSLLQLMGFESDHCLGHTDGHRHFCVIHRPTVLDSPSLDLIAFMFLLLIVLISARVVMDILQARQFRKALGAWRLVDRDGAVSIMDTDLPLAFTSGIFRPRIVLSTGLLQTLSDEERVLLIAHEKAHIERRDSLKSLLARSLSLAHLPWVRKALLAQFHLACEQACDEAAVRRSDSPHKMAELLVKIERLYQSHFPAHAPLVFNVLGHKGSTLPARIHALLSPGVATQFPRVVTIAALGIGLLAIVGHDFLHDWLEHVLNIFHE
jgi:Zn-dependent protease with chaperone function